MGRKLAVLVLVPVIAGLSATAFAARDRHDQGRDYRQQHSQWNRDDRRDRDRWEGRPYYWRGRPYWRLNIRLFPRVGITVWRRGYWYQGWHRGRWGWWWLAGGAWYYYPTPIYPYPNPYVPGTVVIVKTRPAAPPPPAQAPVQYWYHCSAPEGYYPYVPECAGGWSAVPATPPPPAPARPAMQTWYYCSSARGYYPSVRSCPGGWTPVPVTEPPSTPPPDRAPSAPPPNGTPPGGPPPAVR